MANFKLENVRLSFPALFKKAVFNGAETKFEATFLMPKGSPQHLLVQKKIDDFLLEKFNGKVPKGLKITCLKDGDDVSYDGYEGQMAFKASSSRRIPIIDRDKTPLTEDDGRPYAGCYVNALVDVWFSDHQLGGKQLLGTLAAVQFSKDGEAFGAGGANLDEFDDLDDDDDSGAF